MKRWTAKIHYRSDMGPKTRQTSIEELQELQEIVEIGPHWDTIVSIEITRHRGSENHLTLEQAEKLGRLTPSELIAARGYTLEKLD